VTLSTRAESPDKLYPRVHYGDSGAFPEAHGTVNFDLFVYFAHWGTHRLMFADPRSSSM